MRSLGGFSGRDKGTFAASLPRLPGLPRRRDEDDEETPDGFPFWQKLLLAVAAGLAEGGAPVLLTYALHKLDPGVFGSEDEDGDDEDSGE